MTTSSSCPDPSSLSKAALQERSIFILASNFLTSLPDVLTGVLHLLQKECGSMAGAFRLPRLPPPSVQRPCYDNVVLLIIFDEVASAQRALCMTDILRTHVVQTVMTMRAGDVSSSSSSCSPKASSVHERGALSLSRPHRGTIVAGLSIRPARDLAPLSTAAWCRDGRRVHETTHRYARASTELMTPAFPSTSLMMRCDYAARPEERNRLVSTLLPAPMQPRSVSLDSETNSRGIGEADELPSSASGRLWSLLLSPVSTTWAVDWTRARTAAARGDAVVVDEAEALPLRMLRREGGSEARLPRCHTEGGSHALPRSVFLSPISSTNTTNTLYTTKEDTRHDAKYCPTPIHFMNHVHANNVASAAGHTSVKQAVPHRCGPSYAYDNHTFVTPAKSCACGGEAHYDTYPVRRGGGYGNKAGAPVQSASSVMPPANAASEEGWGVWRFYPARRANYDDTAASASRAHVLGAKHDREEVACDAGGIAHHGPRDDRACYSHPLSSFRASTPAHWGAWAMRWLRKGYANRSLSGETCDTYTVDEASGGGGEGDLWPSWLQRCCQGWWNATRIAPNEVCSAAVGETRDSDAAALLRRTIGRGDVFTRPMYRTGGVDKESAPHIIRDTVPLSMTNHANINTNTTTTTNIYSNNVSGTTHNMSETVSGVSRVMHHRDEKDVCVSRHVEGAQEEPPRRRRRTGSIVTRPAERDAADEGGRMRYMRSRSIQAAHAANAADTHANASANAKLSTRVYASEREGVGDGGMTESGAVNRAGPSLLYGRPRVRAVAAAGALPMGGSAVSQSDGSGATMDVSSVYANSAEASRSSTMLRKDGNLGIGDESVTLPLTASSVISSSISTQSSLSKGQGRAGGYSRRTVYFKLPNECTQ